MKHLFFLEQHQHTPRWIFILNGILVTIIMTGIFIFSFNQLQYNFQWDSILAYKAKFIQGWFTTIIISIFALIVSFIVGVFFALAHRSRFLPLRFFSRLYVELIRGTPLLVQILVFFYVVADAFQIENRYIAGVLILAFFSGAYVSEVIRAGIESIEGAQLESARSLGFTRYQTYRYIIFPQVFKRILPPLAGQFVSLIKDSSLLSVIAVREFTMNAQEVNSFTFSTLESYLPLAFGYLILTYPISWLSKYLEKKYSYET